MEQMNSKQINELVKTYEPLINKMVKQFVEKVKYPWSEIKSMAYEGFALAISEYDKTKSEMNFTQYAAYAIRNNILNCLANETRTVKFSYYAQSKEETINIISIDKPINDNDTKCAHETLYGLKYEYSPEVVGIDYIINKIEKLYGARDKEIFCLYFGLKGKEIKGKDIAKQLKISTALVSQRIKALIRDIKKDHEMFEILKDYYGIN